MVLLRRPVTPVSLAPTPPFHRLLPGVQYWRVRQAFGLDISDSSLKVVECTSRKGEVKLQAFGRAPLPAGVVSLGIIQRPDVFKQVLKELLPRTRPQPITTKNVVFSFPSSYVYLHPFEFPQALTETQVRRAIPFEAESELPITLKDVYFDVQFHRSREKKHHVLFAAASRTLLDTCTSLLTDLGLTPVAAEPESLSLSRALARAQDIPLLIVDIGANTSTITTIERGVVHGAVSVRLGGERMTKTLATILKISPEEAERIKQERGFDTVNEEERTILHGTLAPLMEEVRKAAAYHASHTGRPVREIILSGGNASLKGIVPLFEQKTSLSVTVADPLSLHAVSFCAECTADDEQVFRGNVTAMANGLGLALRGASADIVGGGVNLLAPAIQDRYRAWWKHALLAATSVAVAGTMLLPVGALTFWLTQLTVQRNQASREARTFAAALADEGFQRTIREAAEANAEITVLRQFEDRRVDAGALLVVLQRTLPPEITLTALEAVSAAEKQQPFTITLHGTSARRDALLAFERTLRQRQDILRVEFPITNLNRPVDVPFTITLAFPPSRDGSSPSSSP